LSQAARSSKLATLFARYPQLKRVIANSGWIVVFGIGNSVIALLAGVVLARYIGPTDLGSINYALAVVTILSSVVSLGLDGVTLREISRSPENSAAFVTAAFLLRVVASSVVFTGLVITAFRFTPSALEGRSLYLFVLAFGLFAPPLSSAAVYFNSHLRSSIPKVSLFASTVLYLLVVAAGVYFNQPTLFFVVAIAVRQLLGAAVTLAIYIRGRRFEAGKTGHGGSELLSIRQAYRVLLRDGWPQTLSGVALLIQAYSDQIMLGEMVDLDSVAQYGISMKATLLLNSIPLAVITSFSPSLAKRFAADPQSFWVGFHQVNRAISLLCLILILIGILLGPPLIRWAYGNEYAVAGSLLSLMVFRVALSSLGSLRGIFLTNANILHYSLMTVVVGSVLNVVLNLQWIPSFGARGAIYASFVSFSVTTIVLDLCFSRTRKAMVVALGAWCMPMLNTQRQWFRV